MPETSMHKDNCLVFWKNQIWLPRQLFGMKSKAKTSTMQIFSNQKFWLGILALNAGHHPAACRFINDINHQASSWLPKAFMKIG